MRDRMDCFDDQCHACGGTGIVWEPTPMRGEGVAMTTTPTSSPDRWDADDLWLTGVDVHIERMDDSCINVVLYRNGGRIGNVDIFTRRAEKVETIVEREQ